MQVSNRNSSGGDWGITLHSLRLLLCGLETALAQEARAPGRSFTGPQGPSPGEFGMYIYVHFVVLKVRTGQCHGDILHWVRRFVAVQF